MKEEHSQDRRQGVMICTQQTVGSGETQHARKANATDLGSDMLEP